MNLREHYNHLWQESFSKFCQGIFEYDNQIYNTDDNRFGITLIARPPKAIKETIREFLQELRDIEPHQYYYPPADMHLTVMSIISCYEGFNRTMIKEEDYIEHISQVLKEVKSFKINFQGITASTSCILIQGFPLDKDLQLLRDQLRIAFRNSPLQQSIDRRYAIQTAHSTMLRFTKRLNSPAPFLSKLLKYRDFPFGIFKVSELELVYNDWYQRSDFVEVIRKFDLK